MGKEVNFSSSKYTIFENNKNTKLNQLVLACTSMARVKDHFIVVYEIYRAVK
jgi:hypothetical protein